MEHLVDTVLAFELIDPPRCACSGPSRTATAPPTRSCALSRRPRVCARFPTPASCSAGTATARSPGPAPPSRWRAGDCLFELQALVAQSSVPTPRRGVTGLDSSRTSMLLAVTNQASDLGLAAKEVFVATAGGVRLADSAADLALCLAVASAASGTALPGDFAAIGEVALSGDIRPVPMLSERVSELPGWASARCWCPCAPPRHARSPFRRGHQPGQRRRRPSRGDPGGGEASDGCADRAGGTRPGAAGTGVRSRSLGVLGQDVSNT